MATLDENLKKTLGDLMSQVIFLQTSVGDLQEQLAGKDKTIDDLTNQLAGLARATGKPLDEQGGAAEG